MTPPTFDVIVLGATVAGLTTALELTRQGATVTVLDPALTTRFGFGAIAVAQGQLDDLDRAIDPDRVQRRQPGIGIHQARRHALDRLFGLADGPAAEQIPNPASPLRCDVVQAPHHGSKNSLVKGFYQAAAPKVVVAGTGYRNQWGFPSPELRETLRASFSALIAALPGLRG